MRTPTIAGAFVCLAAGLAGCGGGGTDAPVARAPTPAPQTAAARSALADPASPVAPVKRFWSYAQQGAVPAVLEAYDPRVVAAVGLDNFAAALASQQGAVAVLKLNILDVQSVAGGRLVLAEALPKLGAKNKYSFFLRREKGRWRIAYDSFMVAALPASVAARVQASARPGSGTAAGAKAADRVLAAYRVAALTVPKPSGKALTKSRAGKQSATTSPTATNNRLPSSSATPGG